MLAVHGAERDTAITPSQESAGVVAVCRGLLRYQAIALRNYYALTAFCTSKASSSWPSSL
jgi:hypothetical protein